MAGDESLIIDLFNRFGKLNEIGYIALRRKDESGTILIALDSAGLRYWSTKVAIKRAIEEVGLGQGLTYLAVINLDGRVLCRAGDIREGSDMIDDIALNVMNEKLKIKPKSNFRRIRDSRDYGSGASRQKGCGICPPWP